MKIESTNENDRVSFRISQNDITVSIIQYIDTDNKKSWLISYLYNCVHEVSDFKTALAYAVELIVLSSKDI